ncbi:ABC transporter substrate-binding protein [Pinisolibacter sp.]|uniref:ABC transporter substrate-binding protein n=1 Tax=Pinisolibacter sp. TaxID=2172024 RepID=UPI002FDD61DD
MNRRNLLAAGVAALALSASFAPVRAEDPIKIGLVLPLTGPFTSTGKEIVAAAELYNKEAGASVAGRKVELVIKDDGGVPDVTKRLVQEMIVNDHVTAVAGFGLTPLALAAAPVATQGQTPMVVMAAATSIITERSPFIVRSSQVVPQIAGPFGTWAAKQGMKKVVTIVTDYGPGHDVEKWFSQTFKEGGGTVENMRVPLQNPDFSPFLQRAADAKPDAVLVFVPSGVGAQFMKQFVERGLDKSGIRLIATGDLTDDELLDRIGDVALGTVTAHFYSGAHPSEKNKAFTAAFEKANPGLRPNFMAVGGYDGMHVLYEGLKKTKGAGGQALVDAMKGLAWESPRGPVSIDPETRDIVQNIYIRKVEKKDGHYYNIEFETIPNVKDPAKAK